jgi:hypothetical protein
VKREGRKADGTFKTQRDAIARAESVMRSTAPNQMIIHNRGGLYRIVTCGLPKREYHGPKTPNRDKIRRAVAKLALERVTADNHSRHG